MGDSATAVCDVVGYLVGSTTGILYGLWVLAANGVSWGFNPLG